jgi:N-[(2S)-2-amino-2-carboxyethyl]-L-glutamate dehydrogenase
MRDDDILIVNGSEVISLLAGREREIVDQVRAAYEAHARGETSLPHSIFLRFPDSPRDRIIALPAFLGGGHQVAGIKWVSSFPGNLAMGKDRASAVLILNSLQTGRPRAILEGSVISMSRTAASAALAARWLIPEGQTPRLGLIGCGLINFAIVRFLMEFWPSARAMAVYDLDPARAARFKQKCEQSYSGMEVEVAPDVSAVLRRASLVSLATTAPQPYISDLSECAPGSVLLHVSLRDLAPQAILSCDNVVDDVDHVCRAQTSVHLTEQQVGHRDFIRCTLADITRGAAPPRRDAQSVAVFSPFGLGILDLAVGQLVYELALKEGRGTVIDSFLPAPWDQEPGHQETAGK